MSRKRFWGTALFPSINTKIRNIAYIRRKIDHPKIEANQEKPKRSNKPANVACTVSIATRKKNGVICGTSLLKLRKMWQNCYMG